ncbi:hypothetical protein [Prosthecobacter sp.]|uniref:hypothetical protein n=1 Tax=Prosthecobacter sp. TaxID=1965333 RepID=UPI003784A7A7
MHHFLVTISEKKQAGESLCSTYYADAKGFTFEKLWQMSGDMFEAMAQLLYTEGYEKGDAKGLLESLSKSNSIMVIAAFIHAFVDADVRRPDSKFRRPTGWPSVKTFSCHAPAADTLLKQRMALGGIEIWSFKTETDAEKCHVDGQTEV